MFPCCPCGLQNDGLYAPDAWLNGHDHANTMASNQDFKTKTMRVEQAAVLLPREAAQQRLPPLYLASDTRMTMPFCPLDRFVTSGSGSLWQGGDGAWANKYESSSGGTIPNASWTQQSPNGQGAPNGSFPAHLFFSSTAFNVAGTNALANGGLAVVSLSAFEMKVDFWITGGGTPTPAPCDVLAEWTNVLGNGSPPNNTAAVLAAQFPGIPTADSPNNTCAICTNASVDPACASFVQTFDNGYLPSGYIVPYGGRLAAQLPTAPVFSCAVAPGSTSLPRCTCFAPPGVYSICNTGTFSDAPSGPARSGALLLRRRKRPCVMFARSADSPLANCPLHYRLRFYAAAPHRDGDSVRELERHRAACGRRPGRWAGPLSARDSLTPWAVAGRTQ